MTDLVVGIGAGAYATIQDAINAAGNGDHNLVSAGTYAAFNVDRSVTIEGIGDVQIVGSFASDNEIPLNTPVSEWIKSADWYDGSAGTAIGVWADGVTLSNLNITGFVKGVEFNGASNLTLDHVNIDNSLYGVITTGDWPSTGFQMLGGSISNSYMGIDIDTEGGGPVTTFAAAGAEAIVSESPTLFDNVVIDGVTFTHITAKGIYADQLSNAQLLNLHMTDVGQYGFAYAVEDGPVGQKGAGIDINQSYGDFENILIDNFVLKDVGTNHYPWSDSAAIAIRAEGGYDEYFSGGLGIAPPIEAPNPGVVISNGSIVGTNVGLQLGTPDGEDDISSAVSLQNVIVDTYGDGAGTFDNQSYQNLYVTGSTGGDNLEAAITTWGDLTVNGGQGDDRIVGGWGDDELDGGTGDDLIYSRGGGDTVRAGDGNDGVYFGDFFNQKGGGGGDTSPGGDTPPGPAASPLFGYFDSADGGAGIDTFAVQGNYYYLNLAHVTNFEVLLVASGSDPSFDDIGGREGPGPSLFPLPLPMTQLDHYNIHAPNSLVAPGTVFTVQASGLQAGESLIFDGADERDGYYLMFAGKGLKVLLGGSGDDGFMFGGNVPTQFDHVDGGGGYDVIAFRGDYSGLNRLDLSGNLFSHVEALVMLSGHSNEYGGVLAPGGFDYNLLMADGNVAAGQQLDLIAAGLGADESLSLDGRAETNGSYRIIGGAGDDTIWGGSKDDIIYGGLGADHMTGGEGSDTYVYRSAAESTAAHTDTIDLNVGDKIDLSALPGTLSFIGSDAFGQVANQLRVFETSTGHWTVLAYTDGIGIAYLVINVNCAADLTATQFAL